MIGFELNLDCVLRFGWPSVTYLISAQRCRKKIRLHPVPLALVITIELVLVFNSAWFSSYKAGNKISELIIFWIRRDEKDRHTADEMRNDK